MYSMYFDFSGNKMHLRAYYQGILIGVNGKGIDIDQPDGFVVFHNRSVELPDTVTPVLLPPLAPDIAHGRSEAEKAKVSRLTTRVLSDMAKG